jgi:hypothetical protein
MTMTNFLIHICVQRETMVEAIVAASEIAKESGEWVDLDCRDWNKPIKVGPKGEVLVPAQKQAPQKSGDSDHK